MFSTRVPIESDNIQVKKYKSQNPRTLLLVSSIWRRGKKTTKEKMNKEENYVTKEDHRPLEKSNHFVLFTSQNPIG